MTPDVTNAVLTAFNGAREAGRPPVDCYRAGVKAWRDRFPDQAPEYAAKLANVVGARLYTIQIGQGEEAEVEDGVDIFGQPR